MRVFAAVLLIWLVLALPDRASIPDPAVPAELPLILLLALPWLRGLWLALLMGVSVLKLADAGMFAAFNRPFNLLTDWPLLISGWGLAAESFGVARMVLAAGAGMAALLGLGVALRWALRQRGLPLAGAVLALACLLLPLEHRNAGLLLAKASQTRQTLADLRAFRVAARVDPFDGVPGLFRHLRGRDSAIIFVESYGRTSFQNTLYASHPGILRDAEADLRAAGLAMRSGWLTSPVAGGQSWLAHGTLASGLAVADQTRYGAMLQSPRRTLFHLAAQAGLHPLAVMPAITLAWPEGPRLGFAEILAAKDMGYGGRPLNWVTMPDQYTLSVLERRMRQPDAVFATAALISSHAPWVPVIGMRDWETIGDGAGFDGGWDARTPQEVWRDPDTVREQYRRSVGYSLTAVMEFAARQAADPPLLVILGDHQPAGFVAQGDSRDVPVHVIGPPDLIAHLGGWGWSDGLLPAADLSPWPMEAFRDRYVNAFTEGTRHVED